MSILNVARVPAVTIDASESVMTGIRMMQEEGVGAVFATREGQLVGCLTERDITFRIVLGRKNPDMTSVAEVMTAPAWRISQTASVSEAIGMMIACGVRHLPVVKDGRVCGMVSLRHMLRERARDLNDELDSIVAGISADGIGG